MKNDKSDRNQILDLSAMAMLVVICLSWGLQQVAIKVAISGISPILQSGLRSTGAAALLLAWMVLRREPFLKSDKTLWWGLGVGLLFAAEFILIYWGLEFTNASRAVIFLYVSPFIVALGAHMFIPQERLQRIQVAGLGCAFGGIVIAFRESLNFPTPRMLIGDGMLLTAAVIWGATTVLIKAGPLCKIAPSKTLLYQLAVSAAVMPIVSVAMGEFGIGQLTPLILGCLAYQIVWVAFITYLAWFWLIKNYHASRIASFTFLTPLFGVLAGGVLLKEPVTMTLLISLILVGTGIYLVNRPAAGRT
jgi:drug/metabolite transporter (DMT)-like permease